MKSNSNILGYFKSACECLFKINSPNKHMKFGGIWKTRKFLNQVCPLLNSFSLFINPMCSSWCVVLPLSIFIIHIACSNFFIGSFEQIIYIKNHIFEFLGTNWVPCGGIPRSSKPSKPEHSLSSFSLLRFRPSKSRLDNLNGLLVTTWTIPNLQLKISP